jgi:hypothetical protein
MAEDLPYSNSPLKRRNFATLANTTLKTSWLLHLIYINKGPKAPTMYVPRTSSVSAHYQCLHFSPRLRHQPQSLISFVPTNYVTNG